VNSIASFRKLTLPQIDALVEYLDSSRPSLKSDIQNLTSLLPALIEDRCLPSQRLKLEILSESQITSGEHASRSLRELLEYADDDYTSFLTEEALSEFSWSSTEASLYPLVDLEKQADGNPASLAPFILDLENLVVTSYADYLLSPIDMKEIEIFGIDFFPLTSPALGCRTINYYLRISKRRWISADIGALAFIIT